MTSTLNIDIHALDPKMIALGNAGTQEAGPCSGDADLKLAIDAISVRIAAVEAIVNKPAASTTPTTPTTGA